MQITSAEFVTSAVKPAHYPPARLPEIAFAGRSNVGKSSMINALLNRKRLVKTSNTPGRTQLINFFDINKAFTFVDLPGYGYARAPEAVRRQWKPMVEGYLSTRATLQAVVLIMDLRRQLMRDETDLLDYLAYHHLGSLLVLTKADKLSRNQQIAQQARFARALHRDRSQLLLFSAKSRQGKDAIWEAMSPYLTSCLVPDLDSNQHSAPVPVPVQVP